MTSVRRASIKGTSIINDTIKLTISKVMSLVIAMVSSMLLSRYRTLEEYGTYSQLLMVINIMTSLLMLGLPNSINYFLSRAETEEEGQRFLNVYYTFSTILSVIVGTILVYTTPLIVEQFDNELIKGFMYFLGIYPWARIINSSIENILVVYKKTDILMMYRFFNSLSLLGIIIIVQLLNWTFKSYMFLFTCVESIFAISVYVLVKKYSGQLKFSFDYKIIKKVLIFSIPIGLSSVVGTLNTELDKLMIGKFLDTSQLALYANAGKEMPVTIIATSITAVLLPQITKILKLDENQKAIDLWGSATVVSYSIICFLAIVFCTFAPDVITVLYSEKYINGVGVFRIYNMLLLLRCTYFGMILNARGKTNFILYSSIASFFINIILNAVCFKLFGFIGPAIATLLSQLLINLAQLMFTSKLLNIRFSKIFPWISLFKISMINIAFAMFFLILKVSCPMDYFVGSIFESIVLGIIWGLLYLIVMNKKIKRQWNELKKGEL